MNLRVGNKKAVQKTIAKIDAFKDRTPITGVIQRTNQKLADRSNALRLSKAIHTLRGIKQVNDANRIKLEVLDVKTAYHRRVLNITVRPVQIGAIAATGVSAIIAKSFLLALKEIQKHANYRMYSGIVFASSKGEPFHSTSVGFRKNEKHLWFQDCVDRIMKLVQSDEVILLNSFKITFNFNIIPSGAGHLESRTLSEHYKKKSVVRVKNNDNNCFWYALANLIFV